jgi:hypothetical protein
MVELNLCRLYRCRPSDLGQEDWGVIRQHMTIMEAEADYASLNATPA